eukprot:CAMPEP_0170462922 /NCGR_PEP_ID=MMETSP0123-20130129/8230_1 /TAXON_ID=182087 /ORGANISM="Favella ehrenbergii, Strain Fehren 1" /LENGTH=162 /DNA_ID=CAMNT_0010728231 /DNA_START=506 /DNA_END=994 /DNA_ORIENTATION=-
MCAQAWQLGHSVDLLELLSFLLSVDLGAAGLLLFLELLQPFVDSSPVAVLHVGEQLRLSLNNLLLEAGVPGDLVQNDFNASEDHENAGADKADDQANQVTAFELFGTAVGVRALLKSDSVEIGLALSLRLMKGASLEDVRGGGGSEQKRAGSDQSRHSHVSS